MNGFLCSNFGLEEQEKIRRRKQRKEVRKSKIQLHFLSLCFKDLSQVCTKNTRREKEGDYLTKLIDFLFDCIKF